jgi:hypothetical protein
MPIQAASGQVPDIYGQVHPVETAELIANKQEEFAIEISKLPEAEATCLRQAHSKCPELTTEEFQLWFLRTEVFNAHVCTITRTAKTYPTRSLHFPKTSPPLVLLCLASRKALR